MPDIILIKDDSKTGYQPKENDRFLFDANIWIILYCQMGNHDAQKQRIYSDFMKKVSQNKSAILISSMILSEFVNRYLRFEFNQMKNEPDKKHWDFNRDYKKTNEYLNTVSEIKHIIENHILKYSEKVDDHFNEIDCDCIFDEWREMDFNDCYYLNLARIEGLKIVSDDAALRKTKLDITIVTADK